MTPELTVKVNGWEYGGWKSVRIVRGMEQIAGTFELAISDRWPGQPAAWPILPGNEIQVLVGKDVVITGYVDDFLPSYDRESHAIRIEGRDKTGDLVDCAAIHKGGEWHKAGLLTIARDLCAPFGITVAHDVPLGAAFPRFALQEAETAFEALDRAARQRGVLLVADGLGGLLLTRAGSRRINTALAKGVNIEKADGQCSFKERFSTYIVKGQAPGGDFSARPEHHTQPKARCTDPEILRNRPICIIADQGNGTTYADRAVWERNVRAGRGSRVTYTVTGWHHADGLWQPNRLVPVRDDFLGIDGDRLIVSVAYTLDEDSGTQTHLEVCRREAYDLVALPEKKKKKSKKESLVW